MKKSPEQHELVQCVTSFGSALEELLRRNISYDRAGHLPTKDPYTGRAGTGVHVYFMKGNADVAYWTPIMQTMLIHPEPREWGADIAASLTEF